MAERFSRDRYNTNFLAALEKLNPEQREAVEHIEGPVLVIAGPGTGKTHILTARIGRILLETDAQPQNILCLTFTDAGVRAMRERLLEFIGPEAHRVHIYTFHSFCNSVIQDNLELFGRQDLEPLSELERVEIIRRLIDELDVDHPLKRGRMDVYFYEAHLYDLFKKMKTEDWTAEYVQQRIDAYLASLPSREAFIYQRASGPYRKGDLKEALIEEEQRRMERLRSAAALFPRYEQALLAARRYDYDDMILWVLRAFEKNEALLRSYQERYLYFLVDEYQDTNGAQNEVLRKLIDYWDQPNIFIVGDDDQSIFEFQGARLRNLTDFYADFKEGLKVVALRNNYRSSQRILDTAGLLIGHNEERIVRSLKELGIDKELKACSVDFAEMPLLPRVTAFPNRMHEEADLVGQLAHLQSEGFPLSEVAIIYARHRQAGNLIKLLEKRDIPYNVRRRINILQLPIIENLRELLAYLADEFDQPHSGEPLLFRMVYFRFIGLLPADIARLSHWWASRGHTDRRPWRELLSDRALLQRIGLTDPAAFSALGAFLEDSLATLTQLSLPAFLERVINRSGMLRYVLGHPEKHWLLQVVKTFFDFVAQECDRRPRLRLRELLDILHRMDANRLPVELNKEIYAAEGVNLLTAHSAKGLEFRRVFLIDCVKDYWEPAGRRNSYRFPLPDTLTFSGEEDALEARRRLFYVAMTRAKEQLHISYSRQDQKGKELQRALFLDELTLGAGLEESRRELPDEELLDAQAVFLSEHQAPRVPEAERLEVDALLAGFTLSISALNSYLRCPLGFYYEHVLKVPVQERQAATYGSAMHNALQRYFEQMLRSQKQQFGPVNELIRLFDWELEKQEGKFSPSDYHYRRETGRRALEGYHQHHRPGWSPKVKVEWTIRNVEVEGVPLTGTIDRIDFLEKQRVRLVDYKTGNHQAARVQRPTARHPYGGTYWRQLLFYKLLFESADQGEREVSAATISYLEPDRAGVYVDKTLTYTSDHLNLMRGLIRDTYDRILEHQFYEGCGESRCLWCRFLRNNAEVDSFADEASESLDD